jgi:SpoVK/Ycf46/Vps4 family AAA+-type ATPase
MPPLDKDPSQGRPITAEWNGSRINIYDIDGIVQDASSNVTAIYDRSDLPYPIERVQVTAECVLSEGEEALALGSKIQLDRTQGWNSRWLNARFRNHLAPQNEYDVKNYQKRPPFHIKNVTFSNTFLIADEDSGSRFILWADADSGLITITNTVKLTGGERKVEIRPPALYSTSAESQITSLMRVTALVADFVNAFKVTNQYDTKRIEGIPLNREYVVGQERRTATNRNAAKKLGGAGLKDSLIPEDKSNEETDSHEWDEKHGIEKFTPEQGVKLSDIGGLERVKRMLQDIAASFTHPEIMEKWGAKRPQGVLLYGEPGTGKNMLAQALANEIGAEMWTLQSTDIYEKWLGNSEQRIKEIFNRLREVTKPTIVFFDEFESMVGITEGPSSGADSARNAVAGIFKQEMNTLAKENPNVLVIAATNDIDKLDPSLIRSGRFDYKIYVPMPDQDARQEIVINVISKVMLGKEEGSFKIFADDLNVSRLALQTDGFSGADITEIFRRLSLSRAMQEARTGQEQPPITQEEIERSIQEFRTRG